MHITLESDYAIRIVSHIAKSAGRCDANNISLATGVSIRFALKILRNLVKSGVVKSFKGSLGGYELNALPNEITLKQVLLSVEGEYTFSRCLANDITCSNPNVSACKVKQIFGEISELVNDKLEKVTIADVI